MARLTASVRVWLLVIGIVASFGGATVYAQSAGQAALSEREVSAESSLVAEIAAANNVVRPHDADRRVADREFLAAADAVGGNSAEIQVAGEIEWPQDTDRIASGMELCDPEPTTLDGWITCYNALPAGAILNLPVTISGSIPATTIAINNASGAILNIFGNGAAINGQDQFRLFTILAGQVSFANVMLVDGYAGAVCGGLVGGCSGGAVYLGASASVTFTQVTIASSAASGGGGLYIENGGTVTLDNSTVRANQALQAGGIWNEGTLTILNSMVADNMATNVTAGDGLGAGGGLAHWNGVLTVRDSMLSNNSAVLSGGGLYIDNGEASVSNSTFAGNSAQKFGGGINKFSGSLIVSNSTFSANTADSIGGGISNFTGELAVSDSTFSGNTAQKYGGGIVNAAGSLDVSRSTFSDNATTGAFPEGSGGGIYNDTGDLTANNSTFSANTVRMRGGGVFNHAGEWLLSYSTFSGNSAQAGGGGIFDDGGLVNVSNSIVANSLLGGDCVLGPTAVADSSNIDSDGSCGDAAQHNSAEINLGPLQDNDGSTQTHALLPDSVALDMATPILAVATDQRGESRPQGSAADIGAFEKFVCATPFPIDVATEAELENAIKCYNDELPGSYAINLTADITLTTNSKPFDNTLAAVLTLNGNGYSIDGNDVARILNVASGSVLANNITLTGGKADVVVCPFDDALNICGGAVYVAADGAFSLLDGSITNSTSGQFGGGIYSRGTISITQSTISGNTAVQSGGGLRIESGTATIINSTISGNSAEYGGGILNVGTLNINHSTLSNNSAVFEGGALYNQTGVVTARNSIIANSASGDDCRQSFGTLDINAFNLDSDGTCGDATQSTTQALNLGTLQDNGGPTWTHALPSDSAAVDRATADTTIITDQRGVLRRYGDAADIGAYEYETFICPSNLNFPIDVANESDLNTAINCYNFEFPGSHAINLTADIVLTASTERIFNTLDVALTINGNGHSIDGNNTTRIFNVQDSAVTLRNITLQRGSVGTSPISCANDGSTSCGGGIFVAFTAELTLTQSTVMSSTAYSGGGIYSRGTLTLDQSTINGNQAISQGGGIGHFGVGSATVRNSTISGNSADDGGGIFNNGLGLSISSSTLSNNSALGRGGAVYDSFGPLTASNSIFANSVSGDNCFSSSGTLAVDASNLDSDGSCGDANEHTGAEINLGSLQNNGGPAWTQALLPNSVAINAATPDPAITTDQRGVSRRHGGAADVGAFEYKAFVCPPSFPINVASETTLNRALYCYGVESSGSHVVNLMADITLTANSEPVNGAPASVLIINGNGHSIDGNDVARVLNVATGRVEANQITLTGGKANLIACPFDALNFCGGAVFVAADGAFTLAHGSITNSTSGHFGGGIYSQGTLSITHSTISGNTSVQSGGAMRIEFGDAAIINSTLSGNSADYGGGLLNGGTLTIKNSTFSDNNAAFQGGVLYNQSGVVTASNSIFANSPSGGDCLQSFGIVTIDATNLNTDGSCGGATQATSAAIKLGPLQDNGGPTWTHALLPNSVAINAATADPSVITDQRGALRTQGGAPDIGAFEYGSSPTSVSLKTITTQSASVAIIWAICLAMISLLAMNKSKCFVSHLPLTTRSIRSPVECLAAVLRPARHLLNDRGAAKARATAERRHEFTYKPSPPHLSNQPLRHSERRKQGNIQ